MEVTMRREGGSCWSTRGVMANKNRGHDTLSRDYHHKKAHIWRKKASAVCFRKQRGDCRGVIGPIRELLEKPETYLVFANIEILILLELRQKHCVSSYKFVVMITARKKFLLLYKFFTVWLLNAKIFSSLLRPSPPLQRGGEGREGKTLAFFNYCLRPKIYSFMA